MESFSPDPKDYVRLFRFTNVPLLLDCFYVGAKRHWDVIAVNNNWQRTLYIHKKHYQACLEIGKDLFGDKKKIEGYRNNFFLAAKDFENSFETDDITYATFEFIALAMAHFYSYYDKTDFLYTDAATELIEENFSDFGKLKEDMRSLINRLLLSEEGLFYTFIARVAEKLHIPSEQLLYYLPSELEAAFDGQKIKNVSDRHEESLLFSRNGILFFHPSPKDIIDRFSSSSSEQLSGVVASPGFVQGRAVVFPDNIQSFVELNKVMEEMRQGDILIAETTSPEVMPACSKAAAIVTNQGGMLSHAAIISRELGIPCLVGTNNSTTSFVTGDFVEVDAKNGIIRKE